MKILIITLLLAGIFFAGVRCNHQDTVVLIHHVPIPSTNHYEVKGAMVMRAPLPQTTQLQYSTDGTTFTALSWGNETFGDSSFGWYEANAEDTDFWIKIMHDKKETNRTAKIVFVANE